MTSPPPLRHAVLAEAPVDSHVHAVQLVRKRLLALGKGTPRRVVLRALRESIRDLVAAHGVVVDDVETPSPAGGEDGDEDGESSYGTGMGSNGAIAAVMRRTRTGDVHATMQAQCRELLRLESDLFHPTGEKGPGRFHDSEAFGHAALERIVGVVERANARPARDPLDVALSRVREAKEAEMDVTTVAMLQADVQRLMAERNPHLALVDRDAESPPSLFEPWTPHADAAGVGTT